MAATWKKNYSKYRSFVVSNLTHYRKRNDLRAYLELFLSLATIIVFSIFALRPTLITIAKLVGEIEVNEETIETLNAKVSNLQKAQGLYNQQKDKIDILNSSLPSDPNPDIFLRQMEGIGEKSETITTSLSLGAVTIYSSSSVDKVKPGIFPEGVSGFVFSMSAVSNYPQLFNLLTLFETIRRPVIISSVSMQPTQTELGKLINISVSGHVPSVPDGAKINFNKKKKGL